jgi:hypothetical protein
LFSIKLRESGSDNFENCLAFEIPKEKDSSQLPLTHVTEDLCNLLVGEFIQGIIILGRVDLLKLPSSWALYLFLE